MTVRLSSQSKPAAGLLDRSLQSADRFWFAPTSRVGLHIVRALLGVTLLVWLLGLAGSYSDFLGKNGLLDDQAYKIVSGWPLDDPTTMVPMRRLVPVHWGRQLVADSETGLTIQYWLSVVVVGLFGAGVATRLTAPATWLILVAFTSNPIMNYGGDAVLLALMLYVALAYLVLDLRPGVAWHVLVFGGSDGLVSRWFQKAVAPPPSKSVWPNLFLRLLQVHFAIIVLMSALHKLNDPEWWAGDALWYPLHLPFETDAEALLGRKGQMDGTLILLSIATYATLFWQLAFPALAWIRSTRWIAVTGAFIGCLGCWFVYGLPVYGPALVIGTLAFVSPEFWERMMARLRRDNPSAVEPADFTTFEPNITREFPRKPATKIGRTG